VKDYVAVALSFATMLLKRLPDAVDTNTVKIAFGIISIVLQIKDEVKYKIDVVDRRILSTVDQLRAVEEALAGWELNNAEERQGMELFKMTLADEWRNLFKLKKQSLGRKFAVLEEESRIRSGLLRFSNTLIRPKSNLWWGPVSESARAY